METREYAYYLGDVMKGNFTYAWDQEQLWEVASRKKVITLNMNDIKHWIYSPCWSEDNCFISIFQVLLQKSQFPDHIKRIKKADTNYPLILMEDQFDKYGTILDGNHRFAKLILQKKRKIKVVYFSKKELDNLKIKM